MYFTDLRLTLIQIINNFTSPFTESKIPAVSIRKPIEEFNTQTITEVVWKNITDRVLSLAIRDNQQSVRAAAVSIFSNIVPSTFDTFSDNISQEIITLVFSTIKDESPNVRTAACRTIGVFVLFSRLQNNLEFMKSSMRSFEALLEDKVLNVRVRASWSIANLCDSLRISNLKENNELTMPILISCLNTFKDNDKVLCNSVRALGNIANFSSRDLLQEKVYIGVNKRYMLHAEGTDNVEKSVEQTLLEMLLFTLDMKEASVKSKWNTCYALGNLIGNVNIGPYTTDMAVNSLCDRITTDLNFKVRIQAVLALSLTNQYGSGTNTFRVWRSLLDSFNDLRSDNPAHFSEYKYIKTLKKQLLTTITHFAKHVGLENFIKASTQVQEYFIENAELIVSVYAECEWEDEYMETIQCLIEIFNMMELLDESSALSTIIKRHNFEIGN